MRKSLRYRRERRALARVEPPRHIKPCPLADGPQRQAFILCAGKNCGRSSAYYRAWIELCAQHRNAWLDAERHR